MTEAHFETLRSKFDSKLARVAADAAVPESWEPYRSESTAERLFEVRQEMAKIRDYFPVTVEHLSPIITDAFLVQNSVYGLCRVFVRQLRGKTYYAYSRVLTLFADVPRLPAWPLYEQHAPEALTWIHQNVMDGLTDIYGFGGFFSSGMVRPMERSSGDYGELPWYAEFSNDVDATQIIEVFSSGGGAYLLINLNENLKTTFEPQAMLVDFKADPADSFRTVNLFPYLDNWMAIALAEA